MNLFFFRSDRAVIYPSGYAQIVGRIKEMVIRLEIARIAEHCLAIIANWAHVPETKCDTHTTCNCRGGENLYPREIEELLHTHPKIAEAQVKQK